MSRMCPNGTGGYYCAYLMGDSANCGTCGHVCPAGSFCSNAMCMPGSTDGGAPPPNCTDPTTKPCLNATGTGYYCATVMTDPGNCGACGNVCPAGSYCSNYSCVPMPGQDGGASCVAPMMMCKDAASNPICTDPRYDNINCGNCGYVCPANTRCMQGQCLVP